MLTWSCFCLSLLQRRRKRAHAALENVKNKTTKPKRRSVRREGGRRSKRKHVEAVTLFEVLTMGRGAMQVCSVSGDVIKWLKNEMLLTCTCLMESDEIITDWMDENRIHSCKLKRTERRLLILITDFYWSAFIWCLSRWWLTTGSKRTRWTETRPSSISSASSFSAPGAKASSRRTEH